MDRTRDEHEYWETTVLLRKWVIEHLDDDSDARLRALIHTEVHDAVTEAIAGR